MFSKCFKKKDTTVPFSTVDNPDSEVQNLRRANTPFKSDDRFSMNIYEEIDIDDLKREYQKTVEDKNSYLDDIKAGILTESPAVKHVLTRLDENLKLITELLDKYADEARMDKATPILEKFDALFERHKNDTRHRLKNVYCYDVRETETFKSTFKAEVHMKEILSNQVANNEDMKDLIEVRQPTNKAV